MYCKPWNAGLSSETSAVARDLGKMFDALDGINSNLVSGDILADIQHARQTIMAGLAAEGWTVSYRTGRLQPSNRCHVFPPGSPGGKRIRADNKRIEDTEYQARVSQMIEDACEAEEAIPLDDLEAHAEQHWPK